MGAEADSYYEYLLKGWLQSGRTDGQLRERYDAAMQGARTLLVGESAHSRSLFMGDRYYQSKQLEAHMEHLTCFASGMLTLGADTDAGNATRATEDRLLARKLLDTCMQMYTMTASKLAPESVNLLTGRQQRDAGDKQAPDFSIEADQAYSLLRPETLESLLLAWRSTGDAAYR